MAAEKVRIYDIAKDLKISNKEVMDILDSQLGIKVKSHSSSIDKTDADKLYTIIKSPKPKEKPPEIKIEIKQEIKPEKAPEIKKEEQQTPPAQIKPENKEPFNQGQGGFHGVRQDQTQRTDRPQGQYGQPGQRQNGPGFNPNQPRSDRPPFRPDGQPRSDRPPFRPDGQQRSDRPPFRPDGQQRTDRPPFRPDGQQRTDRPPFRPDGQPRTDRPPFRPDGQQRTDRPPFRPDGQLRTDRPFEKRFTPGGSSPYPQRPRTNPDGSPIPARKPGSSSEAPTDFKSPARRTFGKKKEKYKEAELSKEEKFEQAKLLQEKFKKKKKNAEETPKEKVTHVVIDKPLTVGELGVKLDIGVTDIIKELMMSGMLATVNQSIDIDTAKKISRKTWIYYN